LNKLRSFDVVTVDGLNALKIVLSRYFFKQNTNPENIDDPFHQKLLVYVVIGMTKMYKIELSCLVNDFNQYADIFEQCIKSFLIYDRESAAPQTSAVESTVQSEEPERQFSDTDKPIYEQISQSSLETEEFSHDKVYLKNKRILAGTIVQETNETIRIRVEELSSPEYFITIPKDSIENIEWMSEQERQDKLQKEEELRQKGYVKFYGHWISKDERNQFYLKAEEEQEELLRYNNENISQSQEEISQQIFNEQLAQKDEEIKELLVQLRLLEEENEKLKSELEHQQNVTNEKLDEFLERERQEVPTGKVAEITRNSIVKVMVRSKYAYSDSYQSSASGAVLDSRGTIITNYYIGKNPFREEWFVEYKDEEYQTKILEYDPILDVAIIRINVQGLEPITIGDADKIQQGDQIINVGAPLGYRDSFTVGRVLSTSGVLTDLFDVNVRLRWNIERTYGQPEISILKKKFESDYGTVYMIQHNAITYAQNNGGPLLNKDGALIGINQNTNFRGSISAVLPASTQGFNMAVSINSLKKQPKFASYLR
ncbi:trypsin-like peptidase domain-containing protein, partial [bacterium]|nr:trypsin-like peptidase domain-containing protein [bacterium]